MTRDELYPIIDWVLHFRHQPYMNAGSEWIDHVGGEPELRIGELAEALCDALCKAVGDLTVERDRLRAAGDALAEACAFVRAHPAEVTRALTAWQEARRG
jgi:hypothetical protein